VINCTGYRPARAAAPAAGAEARAEIERRVGPVWDRPPETELAFGRFLELEGLQPRMQLPGLAALSQGPGFSNLGSLGVLADRVLAPFGSRPRALRRGRTRQSYASRAGGS
jgi:mycobactin lysine-N-oxygenase